MSTPAARDARTRDAAASARASAASWVTTFISVSLKSECSFRFAEPIVSQRVVDDADLRVHVDRVDDVRRARVQRAGEQTAVVVVRLDQLAEHAARVVAAVVRLRRQDDEKPEIGLRRVDELLERGRRRSPATRGTGSRGRSAAAPSGARDRTTRGSRSRRAERACRPAPEPCGRSAARRRPPARPAATAGAPRPSPRASAGGSGRRRLRPQGPRSSRAASCQPTVAARRVVASVETVARLRRQVDAADERDPVVDHDRLLVVAVHRPLLGIERALDARVCGQPLAHLPHVAARRAEERERRARPDEHRTSMRSASSASRLRRIVGGPSRSSAKSGEKYQPVR